MIEVIIGCVLSKDQSDLLMPFSVWYKFNSLTLIY